MSSEILRNRQETLVVNRLTEPEGSFVEKMGQIAQADGLSKIAGRIWGALIVNEKPQTADDLAEVLQVSRASVSTNVKILENLEVIERLSILGERKEHFGIRANPYGVLLSGIVRRAEANLQTVIQAREDLKSPAVQKRLDDMARFYELLGENMTTMRDSFAKSAERKASAGV